MFIEANKFHEDREGYPVYVNLERVMWAEPMIIEDDGEGNELHYVKLFMNVAGNNGQPAELDVDMSYDEFKQATDNAMKGTRHEKSSK